MKIQILLLIAIALVILHSVFTEDVSTYRAIEYATFQDGVDDNSSASVTIYEGSSVVLNTQLPVGYRFVSELTWSPKGNILLTSANGDIFYLSPITGEFTPVATGFEYQHAATSNYDGTTIFYLNVEVEDQVEHGWEPVSIVRYETETEETETLLHARDYSITTLDYAEDENSLYFGARHKDGQFGIYIFFEETGDIELFRSTNAYIYDLQVSNNSVSWNEYAVRHEIIGSSEFLTVGIQRYAQGYYLNHAVRPAR